jgi:hypothetical protein
MNIQKSFIFITMTAAISISPSVAFAYIDPGTGALMLQLLLGGIGGAIVVLKVYWGNVRKFFGFASKEKESEIAKPK